MRKLVLSLATLGLVLTAAPTFAQVGVEIGPGGVGVGIGRDRDRDYRRHRDYRDGYRGRGCRTVVERRRTPSGRLIEKRTRVC